MSPEVVVFSATYIGDLALATLTFDALAAAHRLTVLTSAQAAPLLRADPRIDRLGVVPRHPLGWRVFVLKQLLRAGRRGASAVNFELYSRRWSFVRTVGRLFDVPVRSLDLAGLRRTGEAACLRWSERHISAFYAAAVGLGGEPPPPRLHVAEAARDEMATRLRGAAAGAATPVVVLHCGSSPGSSAKRLPASLACELIRLAAAQRQLIVVLVGTAAERELATGIRNGMPEMVTVLDWVDGLSLPSLVALLSLSDLFVGSDSGPLKIAEAVGARSLSFWGPTSPRFVGPRGPRHRYLPLDVDPRQAAAAVVAALRDCREPRAGDSP